jgi:hypothetical protein
MNPYSNRPAKSFWRSAIAEVHYSDITDLWTPFPLSHSDKIATAGSCFAQHIGKNLLNRGANYLDKEPAPAFFPDASVARRFGYGVYSCRYGNVYTTRQLLQLFEEAHGSRIPLERVWKKGGRFYDALRPSVDPVGQDSPETVVSLRELHLAKVREMFAELDVLVFTMGLTEGWANAQDNTMYPMAPGTLCGTFDSEKYSFVNLKHGEVLFDLKIFWEKLKQVNPKARMLLTVSPVPLTATATENHVLVATTYSKSVLRSVAGELADEFDGIYYFPSYEIISSHPSRGMFFDPNLRTVNKYGVDFVMNHFFSGNLLKIFPKVEVSVISELDIVCDECFLDDAQ